MTNKPFSFNITSDPHGFVRTQKKKGKGMFLPVYVFRLISEMTGPILTGLSLADCCFISNLGYGYVTLN